jgi:hypothetical protein
MIKFICDYCGKDIDNYGGDLNDMHNLNAEGDVFEIKIKINQNNSHLHHECIKEIVNTFLCTDNWRNTVCGQFAIKESL